MTSITILLPSNSRTVVISGHQLPLMVQLFFGNIRASAFEILLTSRVIIALNYICFCVRKYIHHESFWNAALGHSLHFALCQFYVSS